MDFEQAKRLPFVSPSRADSMLVITTDTLAQAKINDTVSTCAVGSPVLVQVHGSNWNRYAMGAGLFLMKRRYTNAQIMDFRTTPVDLIPNTLVGASQCVFAMRTIVTADTLAGAYTFTGAYQFRLGPIGLSQGMIGSTVLENTADAYPLITSGFAGKVTETFGPDENEGGDGSESTDFVGVGLAVNSLCAAMTGGHADNYMQVDCLYMLLDIP